MRFLLKADESRRGLILLVVLAMLTIFAILGLTFVFYADNQAKQARFFKEADFNRFRGSGGGTSGGGGTRPPDINTRLLLKWAYGQLIYDVPDDASGVASSLRGHSLARSMYGSNDQVLNITPFNGNGRLLYPTQVGSVRGENYELINYMYFPSDGGLRDPERLNFRASLTAPRNPYTGGFNADYTYPDANNLYLAAVTANGTILTPSFHREAIFGRLDQTPAQNNNWFNTAGKYLTLRPRQVDHQGLPNPPLTERWGDVQNLVGGPVGNDSIWIDLGYPVQTTSTGQKFKPLFAFLVLDLDNRINLNVVGNIMGPGQTHLTNQGWGKWEIDPRLVLDANPNEWNQLFLGNSLAAGRYGRPGDPDQLPNGGGTASSSRRAHFYAQVDLNGDATQHMLPGEAGGPVQSPFPNYPPGYANGNNAERTNHALLFDYFRPAGRVLSVNPNTGQVRTEWNDKTFDISNMRRLLLGAYTGSGITASDLGRLCPQNFGNTSATGNTGAHIKRRNLVTTLSMDVNRPAISPWLFDRNASQYIDNSPPLGSRIAPAGPEIRFPPLQARAGQVPGSSNFRTPGLAGTNPDADWRSMIPGLFERMDLSRYLPPYPHLGSGTTPNQQGNRLVPSAHSPYDITAVNIRTQALQAHTRRQEMAQDIYRRLLMVTGVPDINRMGPPEASLSARRWLAQLAVNIVDFIDEDEVSTPFNFENPQQSFGANLDDGDRNADNELMPRYWVFGNELPLVVLNEVMTEYQDPPDPTMPNAVRTFNVKVWAELQNVLRNQNLSNTVLQQQDADPVPLFIQTGQAANQGYSAYQVIIANTPDRQNPLHPSTINVVGSPHEVRAKMAFTTNSTSVVQPANAANPNLPNVRTEIRPEGYFIVGPAGGDSQSTIQDPTVPAGTPLHTSGDMEYQVQHPPFTMTWDKDDRPNGVTVLLRRLANPHLPPEPNPLAGWTYNPYITIDYIEAIPLNDATAMNARYASLGKRQSHASDRNLVEPQMRAANPNVQHSLGRVNSPLDPANEWRWLTHLDRQLISVAEILAVSGVRPHELTHRFIDADPLRPPPRDRIHDQHRAPWFDEDLATTSPPQSHRLRRVWELFSTHDRMAGIGAHGRIPGRININTIWDRETFLALCAPGTGNSYPITAIYDPNSPTTGLWQRFLNLRAPGSLGQPTFGPLDRPFRSVGVGHMPAGDQQAPRNAAHLQQHGLTPAQANALASGIGINDTILRSADPQGRGDTPRLFELNTSPHPTKRFELLTKIYDRITTRSNVFAVWLTVGFFEVRDDSTQPPRLGPEIGLVQGANIRHRFFSIVDRTALTLHGRNALPGQGIVTTPYLTQTTEPVRATDEPVWVTLRALSGETATPDRNLNGTIRTNNGATVYRTWSIRPGSYLVFGEGTDRETVLVLETDGRGRVRAIFKRGHGPDAPVTIPGNPGPQPGFDPSDDLYQDVVPYAVTLE